jgi:phage baseplate assembly protein W
MAESFINIRFPFFDSPKGYFLDMTKTNKDAIKSNLMHLLLTNKGERLYLPDFGTNLRQYLFEPNLDSVSTDIKTEIQTAIDKYIPKLKIDKLEVKTSINNEHTVVVRLEYTVTNNTFEQTDFVEIEF